MTQPGKVRAAVLARRSSAVTMSIRASRVVLWRCSSVDTGHIPHPERLEKNRLGPNYASAVGMSRRPLPSGRGGRSAPATGEYASQSLPHLRYRRRRNDRTRTGTIVLIISWAAFGRRSPTRPGAAGLLFRDECRLLAAPNRRRRRPHGVGGPQRSGRPGSAR